mgnify:CR=1 FL=1
MYMALYRKWRPLTFDDVISQSHITETLKNQIKNSRTAHAYLFTGSRGTGKTTCARIFAKAVNCIDPKDGNPCLQCEICRNADMSALTDIIEIDAASNNGVDDIRELREGSLYTPEHCKYKIYIIDEVHMLSQSAFNALLKVMEEPPPYVKFILATTEIHKVPATILSRCQRFDFRRILPEDISKRLLYIAEKENIQTDPAAAALIAKLADGGMRDAISLLDQCSAFSERITKETVSLASGTADRHYISDILSAICRCDAASALKSVSELYFMSKDMQRLCDELSVQFRNLMLIKSSVTDTGILSCMPDELEMLKTLADSVSLQNILCKLDILQQCCARLPKSINKRTEFEMCIIKLCTAQPEQAVVAVPVQPQQQQQPQAKPRTAAKINPNDFKPLKIWPDILRDFSVSNPSIVGTLAGSKAFVSDKSDDVLILAENPFFMTIFQKNPDNRKALENVIAKFIGKQCIIRAKCTVSPDEEQKNAVKLIEKASSSGIAVEAEN